MDNIFQMFQNTKKKPKVSANSFQSIDENIVKIQLEDTIILSTDEKGEELLRIGVHIGENLVTVRFPTLGMWDNYQKALLKLFTLLANYVPNLQLPDDMHATIRDKTDYLKYIETTCALLHVRQVQKLIIKIFFKYCRPRLADKKNLNWYDKREIIDNITVQEIVLLFSALLLPDQWVKKKHEIPFDPSLPASDATSTRAHLIEKWHGTIAEWNNTSILSIRQLLRSDSETQSKETERFRKQTHHDD